MKHAKYKLAILLFLVILIGCKKEDDKELNKIDSLVGSYSGDFRDGGWSNYCPTITKLNNSTGLIDRWPMGFDSIQIRLDGVKLVIDEQIFDMFSYSHGDGDIQYFKIKLSASGSFINDTIKMSFIEEIKYYGESIYNPYKTGTFSVAKDK